MQKELLVSHKIYPLDMFQNALHSLDQKGRYSLLFSTGNMKFIILCTRMLISHTMYINY